MEQTAVKLIAHMSEEMMHSLFRPEHFELELKNGTPYPPLRIPTKNGLVTVGGIIDRVDLYKDCLLYTSASETGSVVTNGMSEYARDGQNSNAALLVGITPEDFGSAHPLAGIAFQRKIERAAFEAVSYTHLDVYKRQAYIVDPSLRIADDLIR